MWLSSAEIIDAAMVVLGVVLIAVILGGAWWALSSDKHDQGRA